MRLEGIYPQDGSVYKPPKSKKDVERGRESVIAVSLDDRAKQEQKQKKEQSTTDEEQGEKNSEESHLDLVV